MSTKIGGKIKAFSVLKPGEYIKAPEPVVLKSVQPADRQMILATKEGDIQPVRFPSRPRSINGFQAWVSDFIVVDEEQKFALSISHYINGITHPFEVFAMGQEQPPSASLICQMLSKVLSTNDKPFIKHYLSSLKRAGGKAFESTLPYTGETYTAKSVGSAIAQVVEAHCQHIGYFNDQDDDLESPMLNAMTSRTEQKSKGQGGLAAFDDVFNSLAGHDFPIFIKEAWLESEGQNVPISVWFGTQQAPPDSDAILKILSLSMRQRDLRWPAMFLKILRSHVDFGKEYGFGSVGDKKPTFYASTWAYVADLIIYRYQQLGIFDAEGKHLLQASLFVAEEPDVVTIIQDKTPKGLPCPSCSSTNTQMSEGCLSCNNCTYSRCS